MRIVFVTTQLDLVNGGGSNFDRIIKAKDFIKLGAEVKFVTIFSQKNNLISDFPYEVKEEFLYPQKMRFFAFHKAVSCILKKYEAETDVYYIDGHVFWFGAGLYKKSGGKPVMAHLENYHFPTGIISISLSQRFKLILIKLFEKYILSYWTKKIDVFIPVSPTIGELYAQRGLRGCEFLVTPDFIDYSVFKIKNKFRCPQKAGFHIIYNGRVVKERNVDLILKALVYLKDLDLCLDVIGSGSEKENLLKLARNLGIEEKVYWHGRIEHDDLGDVFEHSDLLILTSQWIDALGMAAVEALGCGVPVIVPAKTGDEWGAGNAGLSYKIGDAKDLADKIKIIYENPGLRKKMSENGIRRGKEVFDHVKLANTLYKKMEQLIK